MLRIRSLFAFFIYSSLSAAVIPVGPKQSVKDLKGIKDGNEYVLDFGNYSVQSMTIKKSLTIRSANPSARATVKFPNAWGGTNSSGPDVGSNANATLNCFGVCTLKDLKISGGEAVIALTSQPGSTVLAQHIDMDGGGIFRGSGGNKITINNVQSSGRPHAYFIANFNNHVKEFSVDLSANMMPVQQGGWCKSGKPTCSNKGSDLAQGEAAIRFMDVDHLVLKGVTTKPWLFNGKSVWKQEVQLRPDSGKFEIFNSHFVLVDAGDIASRAVPAHVISQVDFHDSIIDQGVHETPGILQINYLNTKVGGSLIVKKTDNFGFTCPKSGTVKGCKLIQK